MAPNREQTPQDTEIMSRMFKALEMARSALVQAHAIGQPQPETLSIAILAAALFPEVKPDPQH
jgi:hypothetical protein